MKVYKKQKAKGFTLIEGLVALFVFSVMTMTFYSAFAVGISRLADAQKRLQAMTLATEQMEKIRNLAYEDVGFMGGVPACESNCVLVPEEERELENGTFVIETGIQYRDDAEDGTLADSSDAVPNDYKRVTVRVAWGDRSEERSVNMVARFVPPGVEQGIPNTGALSINVSDYSGTPVSDVRVAITGVTGNFFTDATGNLFLLGIPVNTTGYPIRLTKSGYETLETLLFPPAGAFPPKNPPVLVMDGVINVGNFDLNPITDITFRIQDPFGNKLPDIDFLVSGGRRLDNNAEPTNYEYMNEAKSSDNEGNLIFNERSGGEYTFVVDTPGYTFLHASLPGNSLESVMFPYGGTHSGEYVTLVDHSQPGILVRVLAEGEDPKNPVDEAEVHITDDAGVYDVTQTVDINGFAYFPKTEGQLLPGVNYTVNVSADGFHSQEEMITPLGLEMPIIILQPDV